MQRYSNTVKMVHVPTGIFAQASEYRSQHHNRDAAYRLLRSKLEIGTNLPLPIVADYEFTDDEPFPDDISQYRKNPTP